MPFVSCHVQRATCCSLLKVPASRPRRATTNRTRLAVPYAAEAEYESVTRLRELKDLPVEYGLPVLGSLMDMTAQEAGSLFGKRLFEKHRSDAVWVNLGPGDGWMVALHTTEHMYDVSVTEGHNMFMKFPSWVETSMHPTGRSMTNEEIKPWRRAVARVLSSPNMMKDQLPLLVDHYSETLQKHAASGKEVQWFDEAMKLTFPTAARAALGDVLREDDLEYLFPIWEQMGLGFFLPKFGLKEGIPFSAFWRAVQAHKKMTDFLTQRITCVLENPELVQGPDCTVKEMIATLEGEGVDTTLEKKMVAKKLAEEVIWLMFTGTDGTGHLINFAMQRLAQHPKWLDALAAEQRRLMAEHGDTFDSKVLSKSSVALAVTQELLRVKPLVTFLVRQTTDDVIIGDLGLPKGTKLAMFPVEATMSTGNGTAEFDPGHWLSEDHTKCTSVEGDRRFFAFGKGVRDCPGRNLAWVELVAYMAVLGREVKRIDMDQDEIDRKFLGVHPTGMPLTLIPHSSDSKPSAGCISGTPKTSEEVLRRATCPFA